MIDQSIIRTKIQAERKKLSDEKQTEYSSEICQQIINNGVLNEAEHIAIYLPVRGEADPTLLQGLSELSEKHFYLPVLSVTNENHLDFALYNEQTLMKRNRFNIPEPDVDPADLLTDPKKLDVVIMPGVAVDPLGNRIGMGGGFYDRTFAFRKTERCKPHLLAFAYDFQLIQEQKPQPWDVPADSIALQDEFIEL